MVLKEGDNAATFNMTVDDDKKSKLYYFKGKNVAHYFYPKDNTTGCNKEAIGFTGSIAKLNYAIAFVISASKDPVENQIKFRDKYSLKAPLTTDKTGSSCQNYVVWAKKMNYSNACMQV